MAELFDKDRKTITEHISNVFKEKELTKLLVYRDFQHTAEDGKKYKVKHYNLAAIISVGYRVKSKRGTQFRIWATNVLKSHLVNGVSIHEKRLMKIANKLDKHDKEVQNWMHDLKNLYESKDKVNQILKTYVTDSHITNLSIGNQSLSLKVEKGDIESLKNYLLNNGISKTDTRNLEKAVKEEKKLGVKVQECLGKMAVGCVKKSGDVAFALITEAIKKYYGL